MNIFLLTGSEMRSIRKSQHLKCSDIFAQMGLTESKYQTFEKSDIVPFRISGLFQKAMNLSDEEFNLLLNTIKNNTKE